MATTTQPSVSVDSGTILICDPCRLVRGKDWSDLVAKIPASGPMDFAHGVIVGGFGGDGQFPVEIKRTKDGLVKSVTVRFFPD